MLARRMRSRLPRQIRIAPGLTLVVGKPQGHDRRGRAIGTPEVTRLRRPMSTRELTFWVVFTAVLCIGAVVGVFVWDQLPPISMREVASVAIGSGRAKVRPAAADFTGTALVIDGDTIEVSGQRIRLWGIDAPETRQTCQGREGQTYECGRDAAAVLRELTAGRNIECTARDRDRYQRVVAVCRTEAGEINAAMVRRGWAVDYTQYSGGRYQAEAAAAKNDRLGIWSGRFDLPSEWRQERR